MIGVPLPCYLGMAVLAATHLAPSDFTRGLMVVVALTLTAWPGLSRWWGR